MSVAVHLRVIMYLLAQFPAVVTSVTVTVTKPLQLSETVIEAV
jgi:hypothetical protein